MESNLPESTQHTVGQGGPRPWVSQEAEPLMLCFSWGPAPVFPEMSTQSAHTLGLPGSRRTVVTGVKWEVSERRHLKHSWSTSVDGYTLACPSLTSGPTDTVPRPPLCPNLTDRSCCRPIPVQSPLNMGEDRQSPRQASEVYASFANPRQTSHPT